MSAQRQRLGRAAEDLAARRLRDAGYEIVERNARPAGARGELDIVARRGAVLAFVEVKARREGSRAGPASPLEAIGPDKRRRLRALAAAWLRANPHAGARELRFDAIGVRFDGAGRVSAYEHLRGAF